MTVVEALRDALQIPHPATSRSEVHRIVARRLDELTTGTSIKSTGYFNHAWAPDLVVNSGDKSERRIYLRFGIADITASDDLRYLSEEGPMFLDLDAANPSPSAEHSRTDGDADDDAALRHALSTEQSAEVLVTEVEAIGEFEAGIAENVDLRTATQQIVLGGRGFIDDDAAGTISKHWHAAAEAANAADSPHLREALDYVERFLNRISALDLETHLRARWMAAGQLADTFPGREDWDLADRAPWEVARLALSLIDRKQAVTSEQWTSIAEAVSASSLGHELYRIGEYRQGNSVNDLARVGLSLWTATSAYVPPLPSDSTERFEWSIGDYSLALNLASHRAYFTDIPKKWSRVPRSNRLPNAKARRDLLLTGEVTGVGLTTPEENARYELKATASMSLGRRLEQQLGDGAEPAWAAARITTLDLRVRGSDATATIDFNRSVVRTSGAVPLRTFVLLCARYVAGLTEPEIAELELALDGTGHTLH